MHTVLSWVLLASCGRTNVASHGWHGMRARVPACLPVCGMGVLPGNVDHHHGSVHICFGPVCSERCQGVCTRTPTCAHVWRVQSHKHTPQVAQRVVAGEVGTVEARARAHTRKCTCTRSSRSSHICWCRRALTTAGGITTDISRCYSAISDSQEIESLRHMPKGKWSAEWGKFAPAT